MAIDVCVDVPEGIDFIDANRMPPKKLKARHPRWFLGRDCPQNHEIAEGFRYQGRGIEGHDGDSGATGGRLRTLRVDFTFSFPNHFRNRHFQHAAQSA